MPASLSLPPRMTQADFEALSPDPFPWEERGSFANGAAIAVLLMIAAGGIIGFCVTLAGV